MNLWAEHDSSNFYEYYIKEIIHFEIFGFEVIHIIFILAFASLVISFSLANKEKELNYQKELTLNYSGEIKELKFQVNNSAQLLWQNHKELLGVKRDEIISETAKKFIDTYPKVQAVQIYKITTKFIEDDALIKINYVTGHADDMININSMSQCYHIIDKKMYLEFIQNVRPSLNAINDDNIDDVISIVSNFLIRYSKTIKNQKPKNLNFKDANRYALIKVILEKLCSLDEDLDIKLFDSSIEKRLTKFKTGLFRSVLLEDSYFFKYESNGKITNKTNRFYTSLPFKYLDEDRIVLIVFDGGITELYDAEDTTFAFSTLIEDSLQKWYNVNKNYERSDNDEAEIT